MLTQTLLLTLLPLASAHFQLTWPASRGFSDDTAAEYPCGGFNTVNATRQALPMSGAFPLQLNMEHTSVHGEVVLALGNDPTGDDFTIVLKQTFSETGPQSFCIGDVTLPAGMNITDGTNATIQVLTNGDPDGGLYQCTDVTFTSAMLSTADYNSHCTNSTGVSASFIGGASPNGTAATASGSAAASSASAAATSATSKAAGARQTAGTFLLGAAGVIGLVVL